MIYFKNTTETRMTRRVEGDLLYECLSVIDLMLEGYCTEFHREAQSSTEGKKGIITVGQSDICSIY